MAAEDSDEELAKNDFLRELRDLQAVLDAETQDAIPTLSEIVPSPLKPEPDASAGNSSGELDAIDAHLETMVNDVKNSSHRSGQLPAADVAEMEQSLDQMLAAQKKSSSPFALLEPASGDYDSNTAESLVEDALEETLGPIRAQLDDEALRLVDELVAEHAELIRQELKHRLDTKIRELNALADRDSEESTGPT